MTTKKTPNNTVLDYTVSSKFSLLVKAIYKHKKDIWGENGAVLHSSDRELYDTLTYILKDKK